MSADGQDTYALLEFQGYVTEPPRYEKKRRLLRFEARAEDRPPIVFKAKGDLAQAMRSLLFRGALIRATAYPAAKVVEVGGSKAVCVEWEAVSVKVLGLRKRLDLAKKYAGMETLDNLMPGEADEYDVGFKEPVTMGRFLDWVGKAKEGGRDDG